MQKENQHYNIQPADRLASVSEYYFSRKLKEVAKMNAEGKDVISLGIGSPDMPPSEETINVLCENARKADAHGYQPTVGIPELRKAMADPEIIAQRRGGFAKRRFNNGEICRHVRQHSHGLRALAREYKSKLRHFFILLD